MVEGWAWGGFCRRGREGGRDWAGRHWGGAGVYRRHWGRDCVDANAGGSTWSVTGVGMEVASIGKGGWIF